MLLDKASLALGELASSDVTRGTINGPYVTAKETVATNGHLLGRVAVPDYDPAEFPRVPGFELAPCGWCMPCWSCDREAAELDDAAHELDDATAAANVRAVAAHKRIAWHDCPSHGRALRTALATELAGDFTCVARTLEACIIPAAAAAALLKQLPKKSRIPVLAHALVDVAGSNRNGTFRAVTTDLDTHRPVEVKKILGDYPAVDQVMPDPRRAKVTIGYSTEYLARILKTAKAMGCKNGLAFEVPTGKDHELAPLVIKGTLDDGRVATFLLMPVRL